MPEGIQHGSMAAERGDGADSKHGGGAGGDGEKGRAAAVFEER